MSSFKRLAVPVVIALAGSLSACGFQLRGDVVIPFKELHVAAPVSSSIAADLNKKIQQSNAKLTADITKADGRVQIVEESRDKIILSLSGAGRVREYQLKLRVVYTLTDAKGAVLIPRTEMNLNRIMSFDDAFVLAKQQEEVLLYKDMENDVVQQILRRLSQVQPAA
jgi:LPS-assembly lipoprotein